MRRRSPRAPYHLNEADLPRVFGANRSQSRVFSVVQAPAGEGDDLRSDLKGLGDYGTVGLELVLSILVGFFGGRWLDGKLGTHGWLTMIGFLLGTFAGFRGLYRAAVKMRKETETEDERERRAGDGRNGTEGDDRSGDN